MRVPPRLDSTLCNQMCATPFFVAPGGLRGNDCQRIQASRQAKLSTDDRNSKPEPIRTCPRMTLDLVGVSRTDRQSVWLADRNQRRRAEEWIKDDQTEQTRHQSSSRRQPAPVGFREIDPMLSQMDEGNNQDRDVKRG